MTNPLAALDRLAAVADELAGAWHARAGATTTTGQERATLRLFGVHGLDRSGRPLADAVVERWRIADPGARYGGVALPFAMALLEYDSAPQQLALDVASGAVDLALEAELLHDPGRRATAEAEVARLVDAVVERVDANRVVRREILDLLGDAGSPWIATSLAEPDVEGALDELAALVGCGMDLLRVEVPMGRELADRLHDAGVEVTAWRPRERPTTGAHHGEPAPSGSQRGLADLRQAVDEAAAERGAYARLAIAAPDLGAPETAAVAAFERIDLVDADPLAEIVAGGVDPGRALADHVFAHRLLARAGTVLAIGAGPLVVGPDLARGLPSDPATRAGRALAMQALGAALAVRGGMARGSLALGALPAWLGDEDRPGARAVAEVAIRRTLFGGHPLVFEEPAGADRPGLWPALVAAALPQADGVAAIVRRPDGDPGALATSTRALAQVVAQARTATERGVLAGAAAEHAGAVVAAALGTVEALADDGWRAILGETPSRGIRALGRDGIIERGDRYDPLGAALARRD